MTNNLKKFNVTFQENKRYNPMTRTVMVETDSAVSAKNVVSSEFDTFTYKKEIMMSVPSGKRITITNVEEVKENTTI